VSLLAIVALGLLAVMGITVLALALARSTPREPGAPLGLRSAREIVADREALEAEDLAQLLEASNARRRRRGEPERTVEDLEFEITSESVSRGGGADRRGSGPSRPR
jgi:hypothetical protein